MTHWLLVLATGVVALLNVTKSSAAATLTEFAYREFTVSVTQADGRPCAGVTLYGFCRELNLVWPRRDKEFEGRNDVLWHDSYLAKTGADGRARVIVPPGKWGFFAAGRTVDGSIIVAWNGF